MRFYCIPIGLLMALALTGDARAYKPESPQVKAMVSRAVRFLERNGDTGTGQLGGECLVALAMYKAGEPVDHKTITASLARCRRECQVEDLATRPNYNDTYIYNYSIACIFLCEVDAQQYRPEIQILADALAQWQMPNGGWGYPGRREGDTSQTQFGVLALWTAKQVGVQVPTQVFVDACHWLIRVQAPDGSWGYQGEDPGALNGVRIPQPIKEASYSRHALSAASMGSLYIAADALGIRDLSQPDEDLEDIGELPPAIRKIEELQEEVSEGSRVNVSLLKRAIQDGNRWFRSNYTISPELEHKEIRWPHYFRYTYERYRSFRENAERRVEAEPSWYNEGVDYLQTRQDPKEGWFLDGATKLIGGAVVYDTAFAVLFLTRSTKKSIGKLTEGLLTGGQELPSNAADIRMTGSGKIVTTAISRNVGDLFGLLEDPSGKEEIADLIRGSVKLDFDEDESSRSKQAAMLRNLVSHKSYEARLIAVRTMAKTRDFDNFPALIYALSDPDARVVREARDGLRFISRRFEGFGLDDAKLTDATARQAAQEAWKEWYRAIRPDAEFFE